MSSKYIEDKLIKTAKMNGSPVVHGFRMKGNPVAIGFRVPSLCSAGSSQEAMSSSGAMSAKYIEDKLVKNSKMKGSESRELCVRQGRELALSAVCTAGYLLDAFFM